MGTIYSKLHNIQERLRAEIQTCNDLYELIFKLASEQGCVLIFKEEVEEYGKSGRKYNKAIIQLVDCETGNMIETHSCSDEDSSSARENCFNALFMLYDGKATKSDENERTFQKESKTIVKPVEKKTDEKEPTLEQKPVSESEQKEKNPPTVSPTKAKPAELNGKTWGRWAETIAGKK